MVSGPLRPRTLAEACALKADGATPYAGGTDVMVRQYELRRTGRGSPLLFLDRLEQLHGICEQGDGLRVGALTTMAAAAASPALHPLLRAGCGCVGSPALRNVATIGGNVCSASPAADSVAPLHALDAAAEVAGVKGSRRIPLHELIVGPSRTSLGRDELLTALILPLRPTGRFFHRKVSQRAANAITKVSLSAWAIVENGVVMEARAAFGAVGPVVLRCTALEQLLAGVAIAEIAGIMDAANEAVLDTVQPIDDQRSSAEYRRQVAANLMREFLLGLQTPAGAS